VKPAPLKRERLNGRRFRNGCFEDGTLDPSGSLRTEETGSQQKRGDQPMPQQKAEESSRDPFVFAKRWGDEDGRRYRLAAQVPSGKGRKHAPQTVANHNNRAVTFETVPSNSSLCACNQVRE
jgi:hypothetical protein